ncbi:MAG TPA: hypothetical protein VFS49_12340 [Croceibacterium sp.]|nr:hypothetical protein [Croceibacterium sp.]
MLLAAACTSPTATAPRQPAAAPPPRPAQAIPPTRPVPPPTADVRAPQVMRLPGLEDVIEHDTAALVRRFGNPRLEVREGDMRKLQFAGEACVLDVFLYPLRAGAEPVATHVEARRASDGQDVDRASCVAALGR